MRDIVVSKGKEDSFIKMAEDLSYTELWFAGKKNISKLQKTTKIKLYSSERIIESSDSDRSVIERKKAEIICDFEKGATRDSMHHRHSGLNQVLCKLMFANKISIGFSFETILNSTGMLRSQILGRMRQNVRFCRKYKVNMKIASFAMNPYEMRDPKDLQAFGVSIGMTAQEAKEGLK
ncbi:RNase P subunit p30 family protein [Nanoarchaeota archaeon]